MKKILALFTVLTLGYYSLLAETRLNNISVNNFGEIARVSLSFNQKPIYSIRKEAGNKKLVITIPGGKTSGLTDKNIGSATISKVSLKNEAGQLFITINTTKNFQDLKELHFSGKNYALVFDVFNTLSPSTAGDFTSLGDYYSFLGNKKTATAHYQKALKLSPGSKKIKEKLHKLNTPKAEKKKKETAPENETQTIDKTTTDKKPVSTDQKTEIVKQEIIDSGKKIGLNEQGKPLSDTVLSIDSSSVSLQKPTLKFRMRVPITRAEFIPVRKKTIPQPVKTQPIPVNLPEEQTIDEKQAKSVQTEPAPIKTVQNDSLKMTPYEKNLLSLLKKTEKDSVAQNMMMGLSAYFSGSYKESIPFFKAVPDSHSLNKEASYYLYNAYLKLGMPNEAKMFATFAQNDTVKTAKDSSLLKTKIEVWMGLAFGGLILLLTVIIMSFIHHWKQLKNKPKISDEEFEIHKNNLRRAYENREKYLQEENEEKEQEMSLPDTESAIPDYDNPPVIAEELYQEEEEILKKEEEDTDSFITIMKKDKPALNDFQDDFDGFGDDEYKKKMILKLYNDGWAIEEIAKELQISQREIDFIIKMSE